MRSLIEKSFFCFLFFNFCFSAVTLAEIEKTGLGIELNGMWSDEAKLWEDITSKDSSINYVTIRNKQIEQHCIGYEPQILVNNHPSKVITVTIKTSWTQGIQSGSETKQVQVYPGDEKEVGCTGWRNPTGGYDITYNRSITAAWFTSGSRDLTMNSCNEDICGNFKQSARNIEESVKAATLCKCFNQYSSITRQGTVPSAEICYDICCVRNSMNLVYVYGNQQYDLCQQS